MIIAMKRLQGPWKDAIQNKESEGKWCDEVYDFKKNVDTKGGWEDWGRKSVVFKPMVIDTKMDWTTEVENRKSDPQEQGTVTKKFQDWWWTFWVYWTKFTDCDQEKNLS